MTSRYVIVIFPSASETADLDNFRSAWDPLAGSIAAHVTLVYPFESNIGQSTLESMVANVARNHSPFPVELGNPIVHEAEYLFLVPRRGKRQIELLHQDLYAAIPDAHLKSHFLAHMTIGRNAVPATIERARRDALKSGLVVRGQATTVSVYTVRPDGSRYVAFSVPMGSGAAGLPPMSRIGGNPDESADS